MAIKEHGCRPAIVGEPASVACREWSRDPKATFRKAGLQCGDPGNHLRIIPTNMLQNDIANPVATALAVRQRHRHLGGKPKHASVRAPGTAEPLPVDPCDGSVDVVSRTAATVRSGSMQDLRVLKNNYVSSQARKDEAAAPPFRQ
jgi:hypothetical protein